MRLEQAERAEGGDVGRELRHVEADRDVGLGAEVVDLVGADLVDQAAEPGAIAEVAVVEREGDAGLVRVVVEVLDAGRVER